MTRKFKFSAVFLSAILALSAVLKAPAQKIKIRKSVTGRVSSIRETRGDLSSDEFRISDLINNERRKRGLGELSWSDELAKVARAYSRQMARESFFSHYDRDGNSVVERVKNANVRRWNKVGENLFFCEGYDDFDSLAVRGWLNSPEHRRNMLDPQFDATGIGVAETRDGRIYITQVFIKN